MNTNEPTPRKPLRLWPGVAAAVLLVLVGYVIPIFVPRYAGLGMIGAVFCALIVILWWLLFSRARWYERLGAIALMIAAAFAAGYVVHPSIAGGAMGNLTYVLAIPTLTVALVAWAGASRRLAPGARGAAAVVAVVLGCLPWILLRTGGINADGRSDFHLRWTMTPEDRLLAQAAEEPKPLPPAPVPAPAEISKPPVESAVVDVVKAPAAPAPAAPESAAPAVTARRADWPGFRGPDRDGVIRGVQIATDWSQSPPTETWRQPIGPGWSSFAVNGNLIYTQEQRGGDEVVSCYRLDTGTPVWRHRDATRFWESNAGAGPRGTPTLSNGRVYTLGATGLVNVLDAGSGAVVWSRNVASDVDVKIPMWGISSSPLVVLDVVIVAAGGKLAGYDVATGAPRWTGGGGVSATARRN
jgi:outer membrane protein assembly factor BamB